MASILLRVFNIALINNINNITHMRHYYCSHNVINNITREHDKELRTLHYTYTGLFLGI